ncbi:MAG: hypothetical protein Q8L73_09065 [Methylotenera sp.]|nr:hypothetical protein [Methylotenera sp.]
MNFNATLDYCYTLVNRQSSQISSGLLLVLCLAFAVDMGGEFGVRNPVVAFLVPTLFMLNGFAVPRVAILAMPILVIYPLALFLIALNSDADATIAFSQFKSTAFGWVLLLILSGISAEKILFSVFASLTCAAGLVVILFFGVWENVPLALTTVKHLSSFTPSLIGEGGKLMGGVIVPAIYLKSTLFLLPACIYWLYRERVFLAFVCFLGLIVSCSKVGFVLGVAVFIIFIITNTAYRNKLLILSALIFGLFVANKMGYFEIVASLLNSQTVQTVQTVQTRLGHFYSFKDYFLQYPIKFLFGFGLGKAMYSQGANTFVYNTELDHLNLIWRYGFIWSCIFVFGILGACSKSISSNNVQSHIFGIVCLAAFLVAGTNPVLLTPIFFLILTSLVYSLPNTNLYRLNLWPLKKV